jgi:hypothetical protein
VTNGQISSASKEFERQLPIINHMIKTFEISNMTTITISGNINGQSTNCVEDDVKNMTLTSDLISSNKNKGILSSGITNKITMSNHKAIAINESVK